MLSAQSGPLVIYGSRSSDVAASPNGNLNPDQAPSIVCGGWALMDTRVGYNVTRAGAIGIGIGFFRSLYQAPSTAATANLAALANVVTGTAMTLVNASGAGITKTAAAVQVWGSGNTIAAGSLAIDGLPGLISYGLASASTGNTKVSEYDNSKAIARAISITGVAGGAGGNFLVKGADIYGYPMSELITATAGATTANGKKAFKFIYSVTPQFTDAHNYSIGTADIFGLPMRCAVFPESLIWWNNALITASTGFVGADTTSPATTTTGDVRGTYAVQSASDAAKVLAVAVSPGQQAPQTSVGIFGVAQV